MSLFPRAQQVIVESVAAVLTWVLVSARAEGARNPEDRPEGR